MKSTVEPRQREPARGVDSRLVHDQDAVGILELQRVAGSRADQEPPAQEFPGPGQTLDVEQPVVGRVFVPAHLPDARAPQPAPRERAFVPDAGAAFQVVAVTVVRSVGRLHRRVKAEYARSFCLTTSQRLGSPPWTTMPGGPWRRGASVWCSSTKPRQAPAAKTATSAAAAAAYAFPLVTPVPRASRLRQAVPRGLTRGPFIPACAHSPLGRELEEMRVQRAASGRVQPR